MSLLSQQNVIDLYLVASSHAGLSAEESMGQFLRFEAEAEKAAAEQTRALRSRRVSKKMVEHLNIIADLAPSIGATELEQTCLEALETRGRTKDVPTLIAQGVIFSNTLERTRLAASIIFDLCDAMGKAPNGKTLQSSLTD